MHNEFEGSTPLELFSRIYRRLLKVQSEPLI